MEYGRARIDVSGRRMSGPPQLEYQMYYTI